MDTLTVVLAAVVPLLGVGLGGFLSERGQARAWRREEAARTRAERRDVFARYLASGRTWQATVLAPEPAIRSTGTHSGKPYADGGAAYGESIRALAEIRLVALHPETVETATAWDRTLRALSVARARVAPRPVPAELAACERAERDFVDAARRELST